MSTQLCLKADGLQTVELPLTGANDCSVATDASEALNISDGEGETHLGAAFHMHL